MSKKFVRITATKSFLVTKGLDCLDVTNKDAHVPDRLNVKPTWVNATYIIKRGVDYYPSEIAEWTTVKRLNEQGFITIGEFVDTIANDETTERNLLKEKEKLELELKKLEANEKKKKSLKEIVENE